MDIDAACHPVVAGDRLLLCSDGLFNQVTDDELAALLLDSTTAAATADALLELALSRGADDNVSAVVADVCA